MSWLEPGAALWLLLVPALVALYMLRPRARRKPISSLRLWRELPQVERPRARLRRPPLSLLLLLQALLLAAGGVALARPALDAPAGRHLVVLLDASGSMQTVESGSTRFEQAKAEVKRLAGMRSQDRVTLLLVGARVATVCSTCDRAGLERPLAGLHPGAGRADWKAALGVAAGMAGQGIRGEGLGVSEEPPATNPSPLTPNPSPLPTDVYVVSDGAFEALPAEGLPPSLHFVQVGRAAQNRAITALSARRQPNGAPGYAVYARVDNVGDRAVVEVSALADTIPLPTQRVDLPAGGHADLTWKLPAGTAKLTVSLSPRDALAADDQAVLFLPANGQYKVSITSDQPELYSHALAGIPGLEPVSPALTGTASLTSTGQTAFTIVEGQVPDRLPAGSLLLANPGPARPNMAPTPSSSPSTPSSTAPSPSPSPPGSVPTPAGSPLTPTQPTLIGAFAGNITDVSAEVVEADHPLLAGIDFGALLVDSAHRLDPAGWLEPLVETGGGKSPAPLLLAGMSEGRRVVVLTFDPRDSNLTKLAAFPLLMANVADWLYPLASAGALRPGEPALAAPGSIVTTPDGRGARAGDTGMFPDTEMQGIYKIEAPRDPAATGGAGMFAVNMTDKAESDTRPRPHPELERQAPATVERLIKQEQWPPLAGLALALLGAEWLLYCWKRGGV